MHIKFDSNGNLPKDITLTLTEFENQFGYNPKRRKLIQNLLTVAKIIASFGCKVMYVDGSFITNKKMPNDIDVAFNTTDVKYLVMKESHPELYSAEGLLQIKKSLKLDVFLFADYNDDILYIFGEDRKGNKKGIVKILLKELSGYDKKRKAI